MFLAWVSLGNQRSRRLDAMGQRIITLAGTWLALIVWRCRGRLPLHHLVRLPHLRRLGGTDTGGIGLLRRTSRGSAGADRNAQASV